MISTDVTHVSSLNGAGNAMRSHSTMPRAGTGYAGRSKVTSGLICQPPAGHSIAGGAVAGSPSSAPLLTHPTMVSISVCVSERSLLKWPKRGSANHGGIALERTAAFMAFAHGRVSLNVSIENGPI